MKKNIVFTQLAPKPIGPYSQAVIFNQTIYCSGMIALNTEGNMVGETAKEQTTQILNNITVLLKEANSSLNNVLKCSIFIKNMNDFGDINEVYASFFTENYPARETVEVSRLPKDALVEISVIAFIN